MAADPKPIKKAPKAYTDALKRLHDLTSGPWPDPNEQLDQIDEAFEDLWQLRWDGTLPREQTTPARAV